MAAKEVDPNKSGQKPKYPLETNPVKELSMNGTRTQEILTALTLKNVDKHKIAYKIMCNHPFVISIEKDIGFIESGQKISLVIKRLNFDAEKYDSQGRRTCLLLQHVVVSHKADNVKKIWAHVFGARSMVKRMAIKLIGPDNRMLGDHHADETETVESH